MIFAVNFDGTIVEYEFPKIGKELPGAIDVMKELQIAGHKIIIWTCRENEHIYEMMEWFNDMWFQPNAINKNLDNLSYAKHKIYADYYFDDRSFPPFTNWKDVEEYFL